MSGKSWGAQQPCLHSFEVRRGFCQGGWAGDAAEEDWGGKGSRHHTLPLWKAVRDWAGSWGLSWEWDRMGSCLCLGPSSPEQSCGHSSYFPDPYGDSSCLKRN